MYVMILMLYTSFGTTVTMQEFTNKDNCWNAVAQIRGGFQSQKAEARVIKLTCEVK